MCVCVWVCPYSLLFCLRWPSYQMYLTLGRSPISVPSSTTAGSSLLPLARLPRCRCAKRCPSSRRKEDSPWRDELVGTIDGSEIQVSPVEVGSSKTYYLNRVGQKKIPGGWEWEFFQQNHFEPNLAPNVVLSFSSRFPNSTGQISPVQSSPSNWTFKLRTLSQSPSNPQSPSSLTS